MRPYNLSSLPFGEYTIEITDAQGKHYHKVKHEGAAEKNRIMRLIRLNEQDARYMLAIPNEREDEFLVKIYDENNRMVNKETEDISGNFAKIYNLTDIKGPYTFEITDKDGKVNSLTLPIH